MNLPIKIAAILAGLMFAVESLFAQEFLGKTGDEIRAHIVRIKNVVIEANASDSLYMECREEDKRGERYDVAYSYILKSDCCVAYYRTVPWHKDWLAWLRDMIETQEGEGSENRQAAGEYVFFSDYRFDEFDMRLTFTGDKIIMRFGEKKK